MSLSNPLNILLIPPIFYLLYRIIFPPFPKTIESIPTKYDPDVYNWMPANHPDVILHRNYTKQELIRYDGKTESRICLAIYDAAYGASMIDGKGVRTVFDVSSGRSFYGPDGVYGNFAGQDASRGMAKQSFDDDMLTPVEQPLDKLEDLTKAEMWVHGRFSSYMAPLAPLVNVVDTLENMRGWHEHFSRKYIVIGELVDEGAASE